MALSRAKEDITSLCRYDRLITRGFQEGNLSLEATQREGHVCRRDRHSVRTERPADSEALSWNESGTYKDE